MQYTSDVIELKDLTGNVNAGALKATLLNGTQVKMNQNDGKLELVVPAECRNPHDTVVKLA